MRPMTWIRAVPCLWGWSADLDDPWAGISMKFSEWNEEDDRIWILELKQFLDWISRLLESQNPPYCGINIRDMLPRCVDVRRGTFSNIQLQTLNSPEQQSYQININVNVSVCIYDIIWYIYIYDVYSCIYIYIYMLYTHMYI